MRVNGISAHSHIGYERLKKVFYERDKVVLLNTIQRNGVTLSAGLVGVVIRCHTNNYIIQFTTLKDTFAVEPMHLSKTA